MSLHDHSINCRISAAVRYEDGAYMGHPSFTAVPNLDCSQTAQPGVETRSGRVPKCAGQVGHGEVVIVLENCKGGHFIELSE